ncbi:MAG TPA: S9 family peptidase [Vicinamibacterales bacterium]|nr:S9 family peptidase [Vicinamibacterales bacterium]
MKRRVFIVVLATVVAAAASPRAAGKRFMTETDLFKFTWIADPQISPDGSTVAFVRVSVNEKENRYETSLYVVSSDGHETPRRLTSGIRDTSPRWAPDGKSIAFVRAPANPPSGASPSSSGASPSSGGASQSSTGDKIQATQLYLLSLDGGEARALTDLERGVQSPAWSPDGKTIAFNSPTGREKREGQDGKGHKSDVTVVTRPVYRANGNPTYVDNDHHSHIFTVRVAGSEVGSNAGRPLTPTPDQITDGDYDERDITWSRDGATIYFASTRVPEPYYDESDDELYSVAAAGGAIKKLASIEGGIGNLSLSPDGKRIAFVGALRGKPIRSYSQPDLWVVDAAGGAPKNLTANYDFDVAGGIGGDQAAPRGQNRKPILWSKDQQSLIVVAAEKGSSNLERVSIATGKVEPLTNGPHDLVSYSATPDASRIAATLSTQTNIGDLSVLDGARAFQANAITHINDDLFKDIQQSEPEEIWYRSFDGKQIQAWILKPPDFEPSRKYPLILEIHGGPHSAYGNTYTHEFQWMAAKGYVVLFTNPRGSTSYGQDFGNIIQYHYPGDDYKDLMAGVDEVLRRGYVDASRLGVTGGSGGGLLTNWTITQTQRFKAAVAQRDIADWYGFWFTADFTLFQPTWFRKAPWEDPQDFAARSPITHVANVTTPTMFVLGDADYRTPPADGGEMMFRALKYRKIPTVMVRFPRETHELSRSGEPWHRVERLQHIVGWMDQWLQGKKNTPL